MWFVLIRFLFVACVKVQDCAPHSKKENTWQSNNRIFFDIIKLWLLSKKLMSLLDTSLKMTEMVPRVISLVRIWLVPKFMLCSTETAW